jgi:hypothetical protein
MLKKLYVVLDTETYLAQNPTSNRLIHANKYNSSLLNIYLSMLFFFTANTYEVYNVQLCDQVVV